MIPIKRSIAGVFGLVLLTGCTTSDELLTYAALDAGFTTVSGKTSEAIGKEAVWVQDRQQAQALSERVRALVVGKTISADTAVQVALLNNKGLQAAYAEIGIAAADVWQQTMLPNPIVSIGVLGIANPELGAFRAIEGMIANNILALATRKRRVEIADAKFQSAQMAAALETLRLAADTRRAWVNAVAAFETSAYLNQAQVAADAASELAQRLGETGALPKAGQAREHAFFAELTGQRAQARLNAQLAKEELTRLMGLWGADVDYFVPDYLPRLPKRPATGVDIEREALVRRVDLQIAKLALDAEARNYGLTDATRLVTDLELIAGFEAERELDAGELKTVVTPQLELEFVIPIFDSGKARMRKAELAYMRAANRLAEKAVNIRSEARAAYKDLLGRYDIARHYQNSVLPLRVTIEEESLLTYNGMITNTFELLADTRAKVNTILLSTNARRDFWLADININSAVYGGGGAGAPAGGDMAVADNDGGGH
ncbi:TolC family protein [Mesorhizobium sp. Z1-4]|uniref:TolC family protein n=1 Tax=Mesorhizobium sp. Z1-4 TaxID=2448478 RepID=UPI000FD7354B|nr:TolC family protein [Mesorhizobium sp. Z1-4]